MTDWKAVADVLALHLTHKLNDLELIYRSTTGNGRPHDLADDTLALYRQACSSESTAISENKK